VPAFVAYQPARGGFIFGWIPARDRSVAPFSTVLNSVKLRHLDRAMDLFGAAKPNVVVRVRWIVSVAIGGAQVVDVVVVPRSATQNAPLTSPHSDSLPLLPVAQQSP